MTAEIWCIVFACTLLIVLIQCFVWILNLGKHRGERGQTEQGLLHLHPQHHSGLWDLVEFIEFYFGSGSSFFMYGTQNRLFNVWSVPILNFFLLIPGIGVRKGWVGPRVSLPFKRICCCYFVFLNTFIVYYIVVTPQCQGLRLRIRMTLMRIRIQFFTLMRIPIRIELTASLRIRTTIQGSSSKESVTTAL